MTAGLLSWPLVAACTLALVAADEPPATPPVTSTPVTPAPQPAAATPPSKPAEISPAQPPSKPVAEPYVLGFSVKDIDGNEQSLEQYKGSVVLIVNVASKCGYTPQYAKLQKLYESKKDAGLVILGFPANNFGQQEPGSSQEIKLFCTSKYSVTFPIFEKIDVVGPKQHPLYARLAGQPKPLGGDPAWNFTKFLIDREGKVAARFEPKTTPDDPELTKKIDELLRTGS